MTAAELRIGNWYKNMSNDNPFNQIKYGHEIDYVAIYCEPIKLTEEWLLKFGIKQYNVDTINDCGDISYDGELFYIYSGLGDAESYGFAINIKHVHQLQNLYFALTNEELKISEL